jgi:hypothetical protein
MESGRHADREKRELRIRTDGPPGRRFGLELVQIIVNELVIDLPWPTGPELRDDYGSLRAVYLQDWRADVYCDQVHKQ